VDIPIHYLLLQLQTFLTKHQQRSQHKVLLTAATLIPSFHHQSQPNLLDFASTGSVDTTGKIQALKSFGVHNALGIVAVVHGSSLANVVLPIDKNGWQLATLLFLHPTRHSA
jgi:hypothetical protein